MLQGEWSVLHHHHEPLRIDRAGATAGTAADADTLAKLYHTPPIAPAWRGRRGDYHLFFHAIRKQIKELLWGVNFYYSKITAAKNCKNTLNDSLLHRMKGMFMYGSGVYECL